MTKADDGSENLVDRTAAFEVLRHLEVEVPSWAYGNSGTRSLVAVLVGR
jgi:L-rhamnose isomerase